MDGNRIRSTIGLASDKIQLRHRDRLAIVYVRQSTMQQLERHQESTRLQYALVDRAFNLGWPQESIVVIDDDLGRSGTSIEGRIGFQRLVAEVALGHVGLVMGIEMSRLARSCRDWHHLLDSCAVFDTLIADVDGVYDPGSYNDRLLLGLKGTMSEAELHILKNRMLEGTRAKARRGELGRLVPMGYIVRASGEIAFDPDEQAQTTIRMVFDLFERLRTVGGVVRYLVKNGIQLPVRVRSGPAKGELQWGRPCRNTLFALFHNPTYAGAYSYGKSKIDRRRQKPGRRGSGRRLLKAEEADVLIHDHVPAYITWEQYQRNQAQLEANSAVGPGTARAGQALLSGLIVCGRCGHHMAAHYNNNGHCVRYICAHESAQYGGPRCQTLTGASLDATVADLMLQALAPAALEISIKAAADLDAERQALDRQWQHRVERTRLAAERARRQYHAVEPENRLVARTLERAWEEALAEQTRLTADYERFQREQPQRLTETEVMAIKTLAEDIPALWRSPATTQKERQTIAQFLLEKVVVETINDSEQVRIDCHWAGGHRTTHQFERSVYRLEKLSIYDDLVTRIVELHGRGLNHTEIAEILNTEGWRGARSGTFFHSRAVYYLLLKNGVITKTPRVFSRPVKREPNEWTVPELAAHIGMPPATLYGWVQDGRVQCRTVNGNAAGRKLVYADDADIARMKTFRTTPRIWNRPREVSSSPQFDPQP